MQWWNYMALAEEMKAGKVGEKHFRLYLVFFVIALALYALLWVQVPLVLRLFMLGLWIGLTYYINRSGDWKDYGRRLACLSMPLLLRFMALAGGVTLVMTAVIDWQEQAELAGTTTSLAAAAACIVFYMLGLALAYLYLLYASARAFKLVSQPVI